MRTHAAASSFPAIRHALPRAVVPSMVLPDAIHTLPVELLSASQPTPTLLAGGISSTADDLAGALFGASLFPWLAMLYWLKHPTVDAPPGVSFGLTFLLAFVFGSIPAAIGAGALYGVSLADADWLHGSAESLLAITNCVVVLGFRNALASSDDTGVRSDAHADADAAYAGRLRTAATALGGLAALSAVAVYVTGSAAEHTPWLGGVGNLPVTLWAAEPANALSIPTWIIHTSSLVEWLVAMGLAWRYAELTSQPRWKGVTWGMLPLHTSGIVACTYHLFYNAPAVSWCVALQAGMTCVGNTTLAIACLRLALASGWTWQTGQEDLVALLDSLRAELATLTGAEASLSADAPARARPTTDGASEPAPAPAASGDSELFGWEDLGDAWARDTDVFFVLKLAAISAALAYLVKYAPALAPGAVASAVANLPDEVVSAAAFTVIVVPTMLNCAKWAQRSKDGAEFVGDI